MIVVIFVNTPAVILLCRCHRFSNGMYFILEMKLLEPHSKCYTVSPANYTEEFWRHFLNTLVCQSFPPPPPTRSLRIISFPPIRIPFPEWIGSILPQLPFKNFFPPPVAIFKGRSSLWPVGVMLVWLYWQRAKKWCHPSNPSFSQFYLHHSLSWKHTHTHHIPNQLPLYCQGLSHMPRLTSLLQLPTVTCTVSYN